MRRQIINSLLLFVIILLALTPAIQTATQDKDSAAAKEKARLLRLLQVAGPLDSISGSFRHDQKQENVITLISLLHGKH